MNTGAKITLGIGIVTLLLGGIITILGGATVDIDEDSFSIEKASVWNGTNVNSVTLDLNDYGIYSVYLENGTGDVGSLSISIINETEYDEYFQCEWDEDGDSNICTHLGGWTAVGWLYEPDCPCELSIQGGGDVIIVDDKLWEEQVEEEALDLLGSFAAMGSGCCVGCLGIIILIIGIIMAISMKDAPSSGVMMVQQADGTVQPVGIMQQPNAASPMVGGAVHPAFATEQPASQPVQQQTTQQGQILPPIGGGQQPPNQGF